MLFGEVIVKNKIMKKLILFTLLLCFAASCAPTSKNILAPNKRVLNNYPKDAHPDFVQGYKDGCETGRSTGFATDFYKMFYGFKKDREMVKSGNQQYSIAWYSAMIYCRHYAVGTLKEGNLTPALPGQGYKGLIRLEDSLLGNAFSLDNNGFGVNGLANW